MIDSTTYKTNSLWLNGALSLRHLTYECHVLALFQALPELSKIIQPSEFAGLTGLCFGLSHVNQDRSRLLVPSESPMSTIVRALHSLGINAEMRGWPETGDQDAYRDLAIRSLKRPVVVGPLDMGLLPYHPLSPIYRGLDHCVVVNAVEDERVLVSDNEGFPAVFIAREIFLKAWQARSIPEASASFNSLEFVEVQNASRNPERELACTLEALISMRPSIARVKAIINAVLMQQKRHELNGLQSNLAALIERSCCTLQIIWGQECPQMKILSSLLLELIISLGRSIHRCTSNDEETTALKDVESFYLKLATI